MKSNKDMRHYTLANKKDLNKLGNGYKFDYMEVITSPLLLTTIGVLFAGFLAVSILGA